jgi:anti-sigma regulatory factor (Ser/Thr protein kinase)
MAAAARLSLRGDPAEMVRLTAFAEEFAARCRLADDERARLLVILDELFTNTVTHGYVGAAAAGNVEVVLGLQGDWLSIDFIDDGCPFDPLQAAPPDLDLPAEERPVGGLGIAIVRGLVDDAVYRRQGDRNHLTLRRKFPLPPTTS